MTVVVEVVVFWTGLMVDEVVDVVVLVVAVDVVVETTAWVVHFGSFLKSHFLAVESH